MARLHRPHMSLSVKLAACLDALGFESGNDVRWPLPRMCEGEKLQACLGWLGFEAGDIVEWDHTWALGLRPFTPDGEYDPPANDPRYIRPKLAQTHAVKTRGNGATTAGSDVGNMRKLRHLTADQIEFQRRMLAKAPGEPRPKSGRFPSRPFPKREAQT